MSPFTQFKDWYQCQGIDIAQKIQDATRAASQTHNYQDSLDAIFLAFVYLIYGLLPYILFVGIALIPLWLVLFVGYKRLKKERL